MHILFCHVFFSFVLLSLNLHIIHCADFERKNVHVASFALNFFTSQMNVHILLFTNYVGFSMRVSPFASVLPFHPVVCSPLYNGFKSYKLRFLSFYKVVVTFSLVCSHFHHTNSHSHSIRHTLSRTHLSPSRPRI